MGVEGVWEVLEGWFGVVFLGFKLFQLRGTRISGFSGVLAAGRFRVVMVVIGV